MKWKKSIRKVPQNIQDQVKTLSPKNMITACVVKIKREQIDNGDFSHLGIKFVDGKPVFPDSILPAETTGRYSSYNIHGQEKVRRDLPMTSQSYSVEWPNYGDWDKGSHTVDYSRPVYQREYFGPRYRPIKIELMGQDATKDDFIFKFTVDEILNPNSDDFKRSLFFCLNLLQENTGNHNVYATDASYDDYLKSLYVSWEILPVGELEETVTRILSGVKNRDPQIRAKLVERYRFLLSLKPQNTIQGTSGFARYLGAQFADDLVVFENVEYGNAIYVMFGKWMELSKKPRNELLASGKEGYVRIPHVGKWKEKLRAILQRELSKRSSSLF